MHPGKLFLKIDEPANLCPIQVVVVLQGISVYLGSE